MRRLLLFLLVFIVLAFGCAPVPPAPPVIVVTATRLPPTPAPLPPTEVPAATRTTRSPTATTVPPADTPVATRTAAAIANPPQTSNPDPTLYDDFNNPLFDGYYNTELWSKAGESFYDVKQESGALVFTNSSSPGAGDFTLELHRPETRTIERLKSFEAQLKLSSDHKGGLAFVKIQITTQSLDHGWWTQCRLEIWQASNQPDFACDVYTYAGSVYTPEYVTNLAPAKFDTWYRARIEMDSKTAALRFYLDDQFVGGHIPQDSTGLIDARFVPKIGVWNDAAGTYATRYVDNVRITP